VGRTFRQTVPFKDLDGLTLELCRSDSTTGQVLVLDSGVVYH